MSNKLVVLTAPSGAGKSTIARRVLRAFPNLRFSVSATTRPRRPDETDGVHYHFVSRETFEKAIEEDAFLEFEEVYPGRYYGTERRSVERQLKQGPVLLDIDVNGAANVKRLFGEQALVIFIEPPSLATLEARLRERKTETDQSLGDRLARAGKELRMAAQFDRVVVNDDLEVAVQETIECIHSFLNATR